VGYFSQPTSNIAAFNMQKKSANGGLFLLTSGAARSAAPLILYGAESSPKAKWRCFVSPLGFWNLIQQIFVIRLCKVFAYFLDLHTVNMRPTSISLNVTEEIK